MRGLEERRVVLRLRVWDLWGLGEILNDSENGSDTES